MQFPVLRHGKVVVCDSDCIMEYLCNTYPEKMAIFKITDPKMCASVFCLSAGHAWQSPIHSG
jgi:glutathione S-transferase